MLYKKNISSRDHGQWLYEFLYVETKVTKISLLFFTAVLFSHTKALILLISTRILTICHLTLLPVKLFAITAVSKFKSVVLTFPSSSIHTKNLVLT